MRFSIKNKFLVALLGLSFISLGIGGISAITIISGTYVKEKKHSWALIADQFAQEVTARIQYHQAVLSRLVTSHEVEEFYKHHRVLALNRYFAQFSETFPVLKFINNEGFEEISSIGGQLNEITSNLADNPLYLDALMLPNEVVVSSPFHSPELDEPVIGLGFTLRPYFENSVVGTVLAQIPLTAIGLPNSMLLQEEAQVFFVDRHGRVLKGQKDVFLSQQMEIIPPEYIAIESAHIHDLLIDGENNCIVHSPIPGASMHLVITIPTRTFYFGVYRLISILLLIGVLALTFSLAGAYWLSRRIVNPLRELNRGVKKITSGEKLTIKVKGPETNDEISDLVDAFNDLSVTLQSSMVSKNYFDTILSSMQNYLFVVSEEDGILLVNDATTSLLGCTDEDLIGGNIGTYLGSPPEEFSSWFDFAKNSQFPMEKEVDTGSGKVPVYFATSLIRLDGKKDQSVFVGQDLRDRKTLEQRLIHVQRLEALDSLVAGVNHEFGNLLAAILGFSELIKEDSHPESQTRVDIDKVISCGQRAKNIIRQMQNFRKWLDDEKTYPLSITSNVEDNLSILATSLSRDVIFEKHIETKDEKVLASSLDIRSIVSNLFYNALDAMDRKGSLEISLESQTIDSLEAEQRHLSGPGQFIILTVKDSGCGIDPDIYDKIFDPFFTTKEVGKGTGLGLSEVHGLVNKLGGNIYVNSELGHGSTFSIYLPVVENEPGDELQAE